MKILFISPSVPYPPHTGGQLRSFHILKYLAAKGSVTLVTVGRYEECELFITELKKYCERVLLANPERFKSNQAAGWFRAIQNRFRKLVRLQPWLLDDFVKDEILKQIELAKPEEHDVIVIRFAVMAYYFLTETRWQPLLSRVVIDIDDISTIVQDRAIEKMKFGYQKIRSLFDLFCLKRYYRKLSQMKVSLTVSEKDCQYILNQGISKKVFVIPNMYEVNGKKLSSIDHVKEPEMLFCGMMSYPPNQDAAFFFAEKVFPKIKERIPNAHLTIVGKHASEEMTQLGTRAGISVEGYVPSMQPYYEKAAVVVVPLLNGGGSRIKILEAFSHERPVVSTTIGAEGIEITNGKDILVADDPADFANQCIELLIDVQKRKYIASNAYQLVKEKYDIPVFRKNMDEVFNFLEKGR